MSPPTVATEFADGQPEQPTAAAAIAQELEKKLQVTLYIYLGRILYFLCHGFVKSYAWLAFFRLMSQL